MPDNADSVEPRLLLNAERTILVTLWPDGTASIATRPEPAAAWGPPIPLHDDDD